MIKLPNLSALKVLVKRTLRPRTKWGRVTLWSGGLSVLVYLYGWLSSFGSSARPGFWAKLFALIFALCVLRLVTRWAWRSFMWRLRHRLIVTYVFIGVIPVVLLLAMTLLSGHLFAGQFATYAAISNLQAALQYLETPNDALATQLASLDRSGKLDKKIAGEIFHISGENFPQRTVTVWKGNEGLLLSSSGALIKARSAKVPDVIKGDYRGFVYDGGFLHLRAVRRFVKDDQRITVITDAPITPGLLQSVNSRLGSVSLIPSDDNDREDSHQLLFTQKTPGRVDTESIAPSTNRLDPAIQFFTLFDTLDWKTGKPHPCAIGVVTRPSLLYGILFSTLGDKANILKYFLLVISLLFGLFELIALYIGIRLTRSMTRAVADLYKATEHVNRGDLTHRIHIRGHDQLAELEQSFNSMTESLVKFAAEQKRMQQMESELAIAYEVQNVLFPHKLPELASLDVYGVCRPARSVSGDYYDFIPLSSDRLVVAMGDISGKGISAALLMATAHAFIRAYSVELGMGSMPALESNMLSDGERGMCLREDGTNHSQSSIGMLMSNLNKQLVRCTSPEKYATMFLGCYDAAMRELTYCNAGHLPPIMLADNGRVSRLDTSGTVVGLFDGSVYGESTLRMQPGDLLVAFSDGVTEPENDSGEFGEERLMALIQEHRHQPLSRIGDVITGAVADWIGEAEQPDDVTVVLARAR
ncbi:MAG TPA: PP2C family protein-serine/threonine phosphatase [Terracidiphilus sp.]|nr:PP2C family protein-serine/threonine phosphatase [Terracidiphilus sp.]